MAPKRGKKEQASQPQSLPQESPAPAQAAPVQCRPAALIEKLFARIERVDGPAQPKTINFEDRKPLRFDGWFLLSFEADDGGPDRGVAVLSVTQDGYFIVTCSGAPLDSKRSKRGPTHVTVWDSPGDLYRHLIADEGPDSMLRHLWTLSKARYELLAEFETF